MRIAYCSDLHLDANYGQYLNIDNDLYSNLKIDADVLILAGDIAEVANMIRTPESSLFHVTAEIQGIFRALCARYKHVLYVFGNHEFYHGHIEHSYTKFNQISLPNNLRVLRNNSVVIDGVKFYGGTLWTDFNKNCPVARYTAANGMNDYRKITAGAYRKFTTDDAISLHCKFIENLKKDVSVNDKKVIISHHAPTTMSIPAQFASSNLNPAYASNLEHLFEELKIETWIHGHIHTVHDYYVNNTRILCNPGGYPSELSLNTSFKIRAFDV